MRHAAVLYTCLMLITAQVSLHGTTVFSTDNNHKRLLIIDPHIRVICEGSCDTKD